MADLRSSPESDLADRLELIERRVSDRVEERVMARFRWIVGALSLAATVLGVLGIREFWTIHAAADEARRELRDFKDVTLPEYKAEIRRTWSLDSRLPYKRQCPGTFPIDDVVKWLDQKQMVLEPAARASFVDFAARNNICDLEEVQRIFKHGVQSTLDELYASVLHREPDTFGRFTWGFRLMRAYTREDVRKALEASEEAEILKATKAGRGK